LRLSVYNHLADGANMVLYWHWHSLHYGQETYCKGLLGHDLEPNRVYEEFARTAKELERIGPKLVNLKKNHAAAILFSPDSHLGIQFMPFADRSTDYMSVLQRMHRTLARANVGVDFVTADGEFSRYKLLLIPPLYISDDATLAKIAEFVRQGGHVVMAFKSGFANEFSTVRWERAPGPLRQVAGFSYQEFSNLRQPLALSGDPYQAGEGNRVSTWAEMIMPETAVPLAMYEHPFFGRFPALTRNSFGHGTLTYEGTVLSDDLQDKVIAEVLRLAGLSSEDQELPSAIHVKHGTGNNGRNLHYYMNFSPSEQTFRYAHASGVDLLTDRKISQAKSLTLAPWDLVIIEESR
jgi:beta-galactosidase